MSATALASANPTDKKMECKPLHFDPFPLFSPRLLTLSPSSSSEEFPAHLPVSFVLKPEVVRGNINVTVQSVEFSSPPPNPTWRFREATVNAGHTVSIVMEDNLGDLLVLTGDKKEDTPKAKNTWNSTVLGRVAKGRWSLRELGEIGPFSSHFSWTFLIDPKRTKKGAEKDRETVILEFDILVSGTRGILQQLSSFPPDWKAVSFKAHKNGSISLHLTDLTHCDSPETYVLNGGFFSGRLNALVCKGDLGVNIPGSVQKGGPTVLDASTVLDEGGILPLDTGNWTGTSGVP